MQYAIDGEDDVRVMMLRAFVEYYTEHRKIKKKTYYYVVLFFPSLLFSLDCSRECRNYLRVRGGC